MTKTELEQKNSARLNEMYNILQLISDTLNQGQRNKLLKNEQIKAAFDLFGVEYDT